MGILQTKDFIQITVPGTKLVVKGSVRNKNVTWSPAKGATLPQARAYMDGIVRAVNFVSVKAGINKPKRGNPARVVDTDNELYVKRLLLHSDASRFVTTRREKIDYGIYTKPVMDVDGMTSDLATAMQAVGSIGKSIDEAMKWR